MQKLMNDEYWLQIALFSHVPELLNPLWIMPQDIRTKAKACDCPAQLTEDLIDSEDLYIPRLWFVCADKQTGKQKMAWLVNFNSRMSNVHYLRPAMLDELWTQVHLGYIPANTIGDILAELDSTKTIGQIAYDLGLYASNDIEAIIKKAIEDNPAAVADYKNGVKKALGTILGASRANGVTDMRKASELAIKLLA